MIRPTLHPSPTVSISRRSRPVADTQTTDRFLARVETLARALFRPLMTSTQRGTQNAHQNEERYLAVEAQSELRRRMSPMTLENNDSHQSCCDYSDRSPL